MSEVVERKSVLSTRHLIISEFNLVLHYAPYLGVFAFPLKTNVFRWDCFVMVKEGFYEDGIFRFMLEIPERFPQEMPRVTFKTELLHPMVGPGGEFDLTRLFPDWSLEVGRQLIDVLTKLRSIFSEKRFFEVTGSLNSEAAELFRRDPELFLDKTLECARRAKQEFHRLPEDCPYRFTAVEKLSEEVRAILDSSSLSRDEKKKKLREEMERVVKRKKQVAGPPEA